MKKVVLDVDFCNDRIKQKAMRTVSSLHGIESVSVNMKEKKMSLVGEVDPVDVVGKLRKCCKAEMVSVGPVKEDQNPNNDSTNIIVSSSLSYPLTVYETYQIRPPHYYCVGTVEEDPQGCVIC